MWVETETGFVFVDAVAFDERGVARCKVGNYRELILEGARAEELRRCIAVQALPLNVEGHSRGKK